MGSCWCYSSRTCYFCCHRIIMNAIRFSIKALPFNVIISCIVVVLYFSNNLFFKAHTSGPLHMLLICHFNDFLGGVLFVAYTNVLLYSRGLLLYRFWPVIRFCLVAALFWEFVAPLIREDSVSDWYDVLSYILGGCLYCLLLHLYVRIRHKNCKENLL